MTDADDYVKMQPDDRARAVAIVAASDEESPRMMARLIHAYYLDADRADRTPRSLLYFHMGLLHGALERTLTIQQVDK